LIPTVFPSLPSFPAFVMCVNSRGPASSDARVYPLVCHYWLLTASFPNSLIHRPREAWCLPFHSLVLYNHTWCILGWFDFLFVLNGGGDLFPILIISSPPNPGPFSTAPPPPFPGLKPHKESFTHIVSSPTPAHKSRLPLIRSAADPLLISLRLSPSSNPAFSPSVPSPGHVFSAFLVFQLSLACSSVVRGDAVKMTPPVTMSHYF